MLYVESVELLAMLVLLMIMTRIVAIHRFVVYNC